MTCPATPQTQRRTMPAHRRQDGTLIPRPGAAGDSWIKAPPSGSGSRLTTLSGLAWDVGAPLVGYYTLHLVGASDWVALLAATLAAGVRILWVAVWTRRMTWFAAVMLAIFGVGLALAFIGGDPRFLLLKDSFGTAVLGIVFLTSLLTPRPLTLTASQAWKPRQAAQLGRLYRSEPAVRRVFHISTLGWGLGLLTEAVLRVPLIYLLPLDIAVGLSTAMMITAMITLAIWNAAYITHAAHRTRALRALLPTSTRHRGDQEGTRRGSPQ